MTRKDYIMLANAIIRSKTKYSRNKLDMNILIKCLCIGLKRDNNKFNEQIFINACNNYEEYKQHNINNDNL